MLCFLCQKFTIPTLFLPQRGRLGSVPAAILEGAAGDSKPYNSITGAGLDMRRAGDHTGSGMPGAAMGGGIDPQQVTLLYAAGCLCTATPGLRASLGENHLRGVALA